MSTGSTVRRYQNGVMRMTRASSTTTDIRATAIATPKTAMTAMVPMVMTRSTVFGSVAALDGAMTSTTAIATLLRTMPMPIRRKAIDVPMCSSWCAFPMHPSCRATSDLSNHILHVGRVKRVTGVPVAAARLSTCTARTA
jgi:hypothetical protein